MLRSMWRWVWRLALGLLVLAVGVVATLRYVNPPTTAFMIGAWLEARQEGRDPAIVQRWVAGACLPDAVRFAVIAAEDQQFPSHRGFDLDQIADALATAERGGRVRGASTLTQQTAKNLFLWPGQSWLRKGLEAGIAVLMEALWPKRRILEMYLNVAEFGPGVYGVGAAADRYFGKRADALTVAESALLAAVLPSPRRMRLDAPSDYMRERQSWIRGQMHEVRSLPGIDHVLRQPDSADRCGQGF